MFKPLASPLLTLSLGFTLSAAATAGTHTGLEDAQEATASYARALKAELTAAIKRGGPLEAVETCHLEAPEIARMVSV